MSGEIVVGACYRDPEDGEIVRVLERASRKSYSWWTCCVISPSPVTREEVGVRFEMHESELLDVWERVPDPTPAVIDDAEPPLAGEMTLRQIPAWREARGVEDVSLLYIARTGLWHAIAECRESDDSRSPVVVFHAKASDPQDAFTAMMAKVGP